MIDHLPIWINALFLFTVALTLLLFHIAHKRPTLLTGTFVAWSIILSVLAYSGFFQNTDSIPPRFLLVLGPPALFMLYGLRRSSLNWLGSNRNRTMSTLFHSIRILVEIVLLYLFIHKMVPELMTFEGRNFDILAGLTAPVMAWLVHKKKIGKTGLVLWNVVCLCLVCFIMVNGLLSAELPFQQFAFEQPNKALLYFPYILLPGLIVPLVIYTHVTELILLSKSQP